MASLSRTWFISRDAWERFRNKLSALSWQGPVVAFGESGSCGWNCPPLPSKTVFPGIWRFSPHTLFLEREMSLMFLEKLLFLVLLFEGCFWLVWQGSTCSPRAGLLSAQSPVLSLPPFTAPGFPFSKRFQVCRLCLESILREFGQEEWCLSVLRSLHATHICRAPKRFSVTCTHTHTGWQCVCLWCIRYFIYSSFSESPGSFRTQ